MSIGKVFRIPGGRAVRLPRRFPLGKREFLVRQLGDLVALAPGDAAWQVFLESLNSFTEDFFPSGRNQGVETPRDSL